MLKKNSIPIGNFVNGFVVPINEVKVTQFASLFSKCHKNHYRPILNSCLSKSNRPKYTINTVCTQATNVEASR